MEGKRPMSDRPAYVPKDFAGKCKVFPPTAAMLLPSYQQRWVCDGSRLKLAVKSRQIGLSWSSAYRVVREKIRAGARLDAWISSRDEISALLFLQDAKRWATILNTAATDMGPTLIDDQGNTALTIRLANGLRIHSMTSNLNAQAGKAGRGFSTNSRWHNDPRQLYSIAFPGLSWGGNLEIFSSQRGSTNYFNNELIREIVGARESEAVQFPPDHARRRTGRWVPFQAAIQIA